MKNEHKTNSKIRKNGSYCVFHGYGCWAIHCGEGGMSYYGREIKPEDLPVIENQEITMYSHNWKSPDLSTCEWCGDKDWMASESCSRNPSIGSSSPMHDDIDELDLSHLDTGHIEPEQYQQQQDDGCEGGACKI